MMDWQIFFLGFVVGIAFVVGVLGLFYYLGLRRLRKLDD